MPGFLTHFTILGLGESNPRVLCTVPSYWQDTPGLQAHTAFPRHEAHMVLVLLVFKFYYVRAQAVWLSPAAHDIMSSGSVCC